MWCDLMHFPLQKGYTNTYNYKNEVKLWGEAQQKFEVACSVEIDCKGGKHTLAFTMCIILFTLNLERTPKVAGALLPILLKAKK